MSKATATIATKANTKARQVRALIRQSRTKDLDKLITKVNDSDIGIPLNNVRRYVKHNLDVVLAEIKPAKAAKKPAAKKTAKKPAAKKATKAKAAKKPAAKKAA